VLGISAFGSPKTSLKTQAILTRLVSHPKSKPKIHTPLVNSDKHWTSGINCSNNAITRSRSDNTNQQRLNSTISSSTSRPNSDIIFNKTKEEENDDCDADGDEEGAGHVFHGEIGDHWDDTALDILAWKVKGGIWRTKREARRTDEIRGTHRTS
jgi:hypothetical protein